MAAKLGEDKINEINEALKDYIENTDIPIIAEFAYMNHLRRALLYENEILSYTIKTAIDKKEAQLERKALEGDIDKTMAIFSLKQLGWKDRQEFDMNHRQEIDVSKYTKKELKQLAELSRKNRS
jgi:hypothetical protein